MAASWFYRVGTRMLPKWYCNHPVLTYVESCNLHEVCRVLCNDYIFVDALFLSGYFNSILFYLRWSYFLVLFLYRLSSSQLVSANFRHVFKTSFAL